MLSLTATLSNLDGLNSSAECSTNHCHQILERLETKRSGKYDHKHFNTHNVHLNTMY